MCNNIVNIYNSRKCQYMSGFFYLYVIVNPIGRQSIVGLQSWTTHTPTFRFDFNFPLDATLFLLQSLLFFPFHVLLPDLGPNFLLSRFLSSYTQIWQEP